MKSSKTVEEYILNAPFGNSILMVLRDILLSTELEETIKWGSPVYVLNGKNIIGIGSFKSYVAIWFFQGALLNDNAGVLINAQEDVTKALRQWRFSDLNEINEKLIRKYIAEAINNQEKGLEIKADRNKKLIIPIELKEELNNNKQLENSFNQFTPGRKREFAEYVSSAKQEATRKNRVQKIIPLILQNIGLYDKYRK